MTRGHEIIMAMTNLRLLCDKQNLLLLVSCLQEVGGGRGDWMELAQVRDRWRALVGTVREFRVS
jgi:hypothetical protein